jgi:ADP-heptose:LPS heptosyltransferase
VESLVHRIGDHQHVRNFAGRLSLIEMAALLKRVHLFVTINTGPMHIALALDVPTVAVIGGTPASVVCPRDNPRFQYLEDPALAAWDPRSPWLRSAPAINSITVDAVFEAVMQMLGDLGLPGQKAQFSY